jgi:hypothetical protein
VCVSLFFRRNVCLLHASYCKAVWREDRSNKRDIKDIKNVLIMSEILIIPKRSHIPRDIKDINNVLIKLEILIIPKTFSYCSRY